MRLELGKPVVCGDHEAGKLADLVVDPVEKRVTHLVVKPAHGHGDSHLVPIELATPGDEGGGIALSCTADELEAMPHVEEFAYLRIDQLPENDPDWDVGVTDVLAMPYYESTGISAGYVDTFADVGVVYDRVPKGEVEIRRASNVVTADGEHAGEVDGFLVDDADNITHFVLERGHLWGRREVTIPISAVAKVESDSLTLTLSKDEIGELPSHKIHRWT
ncbi:MAG: PRC-barrel domain-containing protein [Gaiellaceae bacterium]